MGVYGGLWGRMRALWGPYGGPGVPRGASGLYGVPMGVPVSLWGPYGAPMGSLWGALGLYGVPMGSLWGS